MSSADPWVQLRMLRDLTRSTGALHEAQVLQLKYWPRIALPNSVESAFEYDHVQRSIVFRVRERKRRWRDRLKRLPAATERLRGLARSVQDLLGDDMSVRVEREDGKPIFEHAGSAPVQCPPASQSPST